MNLGDANPNPELRRSFASRKALDLQSRDIVSDRSGNAGDRFLLTISSKSIRNHYIFFGMIRVIAKEDYHTQMTG
jgi:hypothetical protein